MDNMTREVKEALYKAIVMQQITYCGCEYYEAERIAKLVVSGQVNLTTIA